MHHVVIKTANVDCPVAPFEPTIFLGDSQSILQSSGVFGAIRILDCPVCQMPIEEAALLPLRSIPNSPSLSLPTFEPSLVHLFSQDLSSVVVLLLVGEPPDVLQVWGL